MSCILEEFPGVVPSQIEGEDWNRLLRIIEARRYVQAVKTTDDFWAAVRAKRAEAKDAPTGPMFDLVDEILSKRLAGDHGNNG